MMGLIDCKVQACVGSSVDRVCSVSSLSHWGLAPACEHPQPLQMTKQPLGWGSGLGFQATSSSFPSCGPWTQALSLSLGFLIRAVKGYCQW
jgi:hypothetical protein